MAAPKGDFLFRKAALDRLRSPEQLDQAITVTNSANWLALAATGAMAVLLLIWSIVGQIPVRVQGQGILIGAGGQVTDAVATASGILTDRGVREGAVLTRGQPVAGLTLRELATRSSDSRAQADAIDRAARDARSQQAAIARARAANLAAQIEALRIAIAAADQRATAYQEQTAGQRAMVDRGFATRTSLQQLEEQRAAAIQGAAEARGRMASLRAEQLSAQANEAQSDAARRQQSLTARQSATSLDSELRENSNVISPANGQLIEWKAAFGTYISAGTPVASIASGAQGLQFTLFLAAADGKRARPGMAARIELNGLPREQWGTLTGRIVSVSRFPATREGMMAILRNDALVSSLSAGGAPFVARIALDADATSPSGYRWTGGRGPESALTGGATGKAHVTIVEQRPISYVLAFLRKAGGS